MLPHLFLEKPEERCHDRVERFSLLSAHFARRLCREQHLAFGEDRGLDLAVELRMRLEEGRVEPDTLRIPDRSDLARVAFLSCSNGTPRCKYSCKHNIHPAGFVVQGWTGAGHRIPRMMAPGLGNLIQLSGQGVSVTWRREREAGACAGQSVR